MSVEHRTLRVEREYPHPLPRVFAAWADAEVKRQWFDLTQRAGDEWRSEFRVGGIEHYGSAPGVRPRISYDARYCDIVADERIIATTEVTVDGRRTSVTLNTAEFDVSADRTRLRITEQAAFLDGLEDEDSRIGGINAQLDRLGAWLTRP